MTPAQSRDVLTVEEDDNESILESEGGESGMDSADDNEREEDNVVVFDTVKRPRPQLQRKKRLTKKEVKTKRSVKMLLLTAGLVKPDVTTDKEKERLLRRIATKGVVQLFNAVAIRQKTMSEELSKKLTMKERQEVTEKLKGSNFDVYSDQRKKEKQEPDDDQDDEDMDDFDLDDSGCKDELHLEEEDGE